MTKPAQGERPQHTEDCAIHGCEGYNGPRFCDCGAEPAPAPPSADAASFKDQIKRRPSAPTLTAAQFYKEYLLSLIPVTENMSEAKFRLGFAEAYADYVASSLRSQVEMWHKSAEERHQMCGTLHGEVEELRKELARWIQAYNEQCVLTGEYRTERDGLRRERDEALAEIERLKNK